MSINVVWFRRDLRWTDHTALARVLDDTEPADSILALFIIDPNMTSSFSTRHDYFYETLQSFVEAGDELGINVHFLYGSVDEVFPLLVDDFNVQAVYFNRDESGAGQDRDREAIKVLESKGVEVYTFIDHHLHGALEVTKKDGERYQVFTPYYKAWRRLTKPALNTINVDELKEKSVNYRTSFERGQEAYGKLMQQKTGRFSDHVGEQAAQERLVAFLNDGLVSYDEDRDRPGIDGTSQLSKYLRTGVISPRMVFEAVQTAAEKKGTDQGAETFIQELAWRDFYNMVSYDHPNGKDEEWKEQFRGMEWSYDEDEWERWKEGNTGFPIVDAAMRQLNQEGWMHNRLRMVTASFLTKDLLQDWRQGERYFQDQLIDYDPASNIGGWQWAASTGTDAVPYFRVFNPTRQSERFDPDGTYIKTYVPELQNVPVDYIHEPGRMPEHVQKKAKCVIGSDYPEPIIDHKARRKAAIQMYEEKKDESRFRK
ncbi:deoxyribodipyrimidine photo-lyase [Geomicrobium sp. JSM 1781026]|uniref:cryptochrome/photolyase family protein n=1 Tax=Geomicrobium sp. JSM 1781026 TaxID=3344580 RepID=UPI0035C19175